MRTQVLIIGAGPYGIAVAQELWQRGVDFCIVGEPFSLWLDHTPSAMALCTDWRISEIYSRSARYGLADYLAELGQNATHGRLGVEVFRGYLQHVLERLPFTVLRQRVHVVEQRVDGFHAMDSEGMDITAKAVVVATGLGSHRHVPAALRPMPRGRVFHSWEVDRIERLRGQSVLVIGSGQSAAEIVGQLRARNRVTWSLRHKPRFRQGPLCVPRPLSRPLLAFSHRLPAPLRRAISRAARRAKVTPDLAGIYADSRVEKVFGDVADLGLREIAGRMAGIAGVPFDYIVAATGYRPAPGGLPFLATNLIWALRNRPVLYPNFQSSVPGLYLVGAIAEPSFGPAMKLIYGSRLAARRIGAALA